MTPIEFRPHPPGQSPGGTEEPRQTAYWTRMVSNSTAVAVVSCTEPVAPS